jgi:hypothetical protein
MRCPRSGTGDKAGENEACLIDANIGNVGNGQKQEGPTSIPTNLEYEGNHFEYDTECDVKYEINSEDVFLMSGGQLYAKYDILPFVVNGRRLIREKNYVAFQLS